MEGLTIGRIVHYVMESGLSQGAHRPAIVVRDWNKENGLVQLQVFTDSMSDRYVADDYEFGNSPNVLHRASVRYSENKEEGTWHWPERV
jgi:hypothetical protein